MMQAALPDWTAQRRAMVDEQLRSRGITDSGVLAAMLAVPREQFVPEAVRSNAYDDRALPIGFGQTISQPFIVAFMTQQLNLTPSCAVLEVGTGAGYQSAVLARLSRHVYSIERIPELSAVASENLASAGVTNVSLCVGDGTLGWPEHAPYDRVLTTAGAPQIPKALVEQLAAGGVLVIPVGKMNEQTLSRVVRQGDRTIETPTLPCRFVKLIGKEGWNAQPED